MKKIIRRTLAIALSLSMVFSGFMFSAAKVDAAVTDHLTDPNYNLAYQQAATMGYNSLIAGSLANLTDANLSQRVYPQPKTYGSFTIDMGKYYTVDSLDTIAFMYNESNAETWPSKAGGLILSYSQDGETFYDVKQVTNITKGTGAWWQEIDVTDITAADVPDIDGVRFVKVTYPEQYTWGVQLREFVIYNDASNRPSSIGTMFYVYNDVVPQNDLPVEVFKAKNDNVTDLFYRWHVDTLQFSVSSARSIEIIKNTVRNPLATTLRIGNIVATTARTFNVPPTFVDRLFDAEYYTKLGVYGSTLVCKGTSPYATTGADRKVCKLLKQSMCQLLDGYYPIICKDTNDNLYHCICQVISNEVYIKPDAHLTANYTFEIAIPVQLSNVQS